MNLVFYLIMEIRKHNTPKGYNKNNNLTTKEKQEFRRVEFL